MGLLEGEVVFITSAASGQGRAHTVASAREDADLVLVDRVDHIPTARCAMSTAEDLAQTLEEVEGLGRGAVSASHTLLGGYYHNPVV